MPLYLVRLFNHNIYEAREETAICKSDFRMTLFQTSPMILLERRTDGPDVTGTRIIYIGSLARPFSDAEDNSRPII